jgi:hypothetical protein
MLATGVILFGLRLESIIDDRLLSKIKINNDHYWKEQSNNTKAFHHPYVFD